MSSRSYDVAVVGASIAGCTAARLYAQRGARVALIERRPSLDAYKTVCTHFIQSSASCSGSSTCRTSTARRRVRGSPSSVTPISTARSSATGAATGGSSCPTTS